MVNLASRIRRSQRRIAGRGRLTPDLDSRRRRTRRLLPIAQSDTPLLRLVLTGRIPRALLFLRHRLRLIDGVRDHTREDGQAAGSDSRRRRHARERRRDTTDDCDEVPRHHDQRTSDRCHRRRLDDEVLLLRGQVTEPIDQPAQPLDHVLHDWHQRVADIDQRVLQLRQRLLELERSRLRRDAERLVQHPGRIRHVREDLFGRSRVRPHKVKHTGQRPDVPEHPCHRIVIQTERRGERLEDRQQPPFPQLLTQPLSGQAVLVQLLPRLSRRVQDRGENLPQLGRCR